MESYSSVSIPSLMACYQIRGFSLFYGELTFRSYLEGLTLVRVSRRRIGCHPGFPLAIAPCALFAYATSHPGRNQARAWIACPRCTPNLPPLATRSIGVKSRLHSLTA